MTRRAEVAGDRGWAVRHLLDPDLLQQGVPHERHAELLRAGALCRQVLPDGGAYWAVLGHPEVVEVSSSPETYSAERQGMLLSDAALLPTLLNLDPPSHGEVRRPLLRHFSSRATARLEVRMREILEGLFDRAAERRTCDFVQDLARPLPLQVICDLLGIPDADRERLGRAADAMASTDDPDIAPEYAGRSQNEAAMELGRYGFTLGQRLAAAGEGEDLVSLLTRATIGGSPVELPVFSGLFVQILIGGHETTRSLLCGGFLELIERPAVYAELAADPTLIPGAIEEMLRWVSPVHYFRRTATRDCSLGNQTLRAGERVVMLYNAANRDPRVFERPDCFDIRRHPNPHVAFGFGEHFCLGARVARLEARVFLEVFLERFAAVELAGEVVRVRSNQLNSIKRMPVTLLPR